MDKLTHMFVPEHTKISEAEKKALFDTYKIRFIDLPKVMLTDPAIAHLEPVVGDVIKVTRQSSTAGTSTFYRGVVNE